jgi:hypothetical protein
VALSKHRTELQKGKQEPWRGHGQPTAGSFGLWRRALHAGPGVRPPPACRQVVLETMCALLLGLGGFHDTNGTRVRSDTVPTSSPPPTCGESAVRWIRRAALPFAQVGRARRARVRARSGQSRARYVWLCPGTDGRPVSFRGHLLLRSRSPSHSHTPLLLLPPAHERAPCRFTELRIRTISINNLGIRSRACRAC